MMNSSARRRFLRTQSDCAAELIPKPRAAAGESENNQCRAALVIAGASKLLKTSTTAPGPGVVHEMYRTIPHIYPSAQARKFHRMSRREELAVSGECLP